MGDRARGDWADGLESGGLERGWWAAGLGLRERLGAGRPAAAADGVGADRLERWRAAYEQMVAGGFGARLAAAGLAEGELRGLLAEPAGALAARVPKPPWAALVERVLADGVVAADAAGADWRDALAVPFQGFVAAARERVLSERVPGERVPGERVPGERVPGERVPGDGMRGEGAGAEAGAVADAFGAALSAALMRVAARTLVLELNRRRAAGALRGDSPTERFRDFVRQLSGAPGLAGLLGAYPVLARLLAQATENAGAAGAELLRRYRADRAGIVAGLLGGADPGPLTGVEPGRGDAHGGGRTVAVLTFADGRQVVYKPRPLDAHARFGTLVAELDRHVPGLGLRCGAVLVRPGYGWLEYLPATPCADRPGVDRFYRRLGTLLALLYVSHASDIHCENLIAVGDQPVLVDLETLFHPAVAHRPVSPDPAALRLESSVYRSALLPLLMVGADGVLDMSGLGGDRDMPMPQPGVDFAAPGTDRMRVVRATTRYPGAANRPRLDGQDIDPAGHEPALLAGFRAAYRAVLGNRDRFGELLDAFAGDTVRQIFRPTQLYGRLLDESTHPDVLRDGLDRECTLDLVWAASAGDPVRTRLAPDEIAELWAGDVPCLTGLAGSRDTRTGTGRVIAELSARSGLDAARDKLAALSEDDLCDQEWIISASLATRQLAEPHRGAAPLAVGPQPAGGVDPTRLLAAARELADRIGAGAARRPGPAGRLNWLGLEPVDDAYWQVLPMGAGLPHGYPGVALFLAEIAGIAEVGRYAELADASVRPVGQLLGVLADRPELAREVGGGLYGLGGIAYALARLAGLTGSGELARWAAAAVDLAAAADHPADPDGDPGPATDRPGPLGPGGWAGLATGLAGRLATLCAVHAELRLPAAATLARATGDLLADLVAATGGDCALTGPAPRGMLLGGAGVGWSLLRLADLLDHDPGRGPGQDPGRGPGPGAERYRRAGRLALAAAVEHPGPLDRGWCSGAAGLLAAAIRPGVPGRAAARDRLIAALAAGPPAGDLSLCHGELGVADVLAAAAADRDLGTAGQDRAAAVLTVLDRHGARCGTPNGVPTAGLFAGLAGIGYGLLRLGFADRVPSLLLLEPGPPARAGTAARLAPTSGAIHHEID
jgi:type 2 lantibiotic biosynthesis protein LanM